MMETHEYVGVWYFLNDLDRGNSGTLKFDPKGGGVLKFIDALDLDALDLDDLEARLDYVVNGGKLPRIDIIHGIASGKQITLYNCIELWYGTYQVQYIYIGHHFDRVEDIRFHEMQFQFSNLSDWMASSLFSSPDSEQDRQISVTCTLPEPISLLKNDDFEMALRFVVDSSCLESFPKQVTTYWSTYFDVTVQTEKTLDEFIEMVSGFKNLISLASKTAIRYTSIQGLVKNNQAEADDFEANKPVEILFNVSSFVPDPTEISARELLFPFFTLYDNNPHFLEKWLNKYDQLNDVLQTFFGIYHNPNMFLQHKFLSAIQSLESYHRRTLQNTKMLLQEHKEKVNTILNTVPDEHKEWLSEKLSYGYEPSLRKRLNEIWSMNKEVLSKFSLNKSVRKKFILMASDNRNYLTHYDVSLKDRRATPTQMHDLTQILMILMVICLLRELGFESPQIYDLIYDHQDYRLSINRFKQY